MRQLELPFPVLKVTRIGPHYRAWVETPMGNREETDDEYRTHLLEHSPCTCDFGLELCA